MKEEVNMHGCIGSWAIYIQEKALLTGSTVFEKSDRKNTHFFLQM